MKIFDLIDQLLTEYHFEWNPGLKSLLFYPSIRWRNSTAN